MLTPRRVLHLSAGLAGVGALPGCATRRSEGGELVRGPPLGRLPDAIQLAPSVLLDPRPVERAPEGLMVRAGTSAAPSSPEASAEEAEARAVVLQAFERNLFLGKIWRSGG